MNNQNAFGIMCRALAFAAGLGVSAFLYYLWSCGVGMPGLLVGLGMTLFVSAMTVAGAVIVFRSKEQ